MVVPGEHAGSVTQKHETDLMALTPLECPAQVWIHFLGR